MRRILKPSPQLNQEARPLSSHCDWHRLHCILRLLLSRAWSVNEIADRLSMSQYNVSKHLKILREAGLVETEKQGKQRFYAVAPDLKSRLSENQNVLELECCSLRFDKLPK
jgi:DNA-binding transcriptional ArsR family regulator